MIHWSDPNTYPVGRGTITMRRGMYMGIDVIHERTQATAAANSDRHTSDKFYTAHGLVKTGQPRTPHFNSEAALKAAIHNYHRNQGRAVWPGGITTLRVR